MKVGQTEVRGRDVGLESQTETVERKHAMNTTCP